ncbi:Tim44 domain-containing protein [Ramlibacter sp. AW1]|uniref:Tim44 domain-containing protein n=1 Tax=Ramlibacter aurantiacus TaxID=2801330 RepID=A0A937D1X2_9BURK|nr:Tim44-like domain-containing protein [Ramlibacter aurantiacus]MBL0420979.1 Tim44 domain-containing protein [Ramlibacter aurantiacus]
MKIWSTLLACTLLLASVDADARRMGGGRSIGKQSGNVTQRQATPQPPAGTPATAPQQGTAAAPAQRQAAPGATPATPARSPMRGLLGGLAAGLGLAWLASALGFGPQFAQFLLFALLALVIMVVVGMVMRARRGGAPAAGGRPYAFQGAGAPAEQAAAPRQYSPHNVGNDASARPFERSSMAYDAARHGGGVQIGSTLAGDRDWGVPAGFDVAGFVEAAKRNFVLLQDCWDGADLTTLRSMMTDEMLGEIRNQLREREQQGGTPGKTEVVMLDAQFLGIEDLGDDYLASVEFSGLIREAPSAGPTPFREVWNMIKSKRGPSGWLVAGLQPLQ